MHPFRGNVIMRRASAEGQHRRLPSGPQSALTLDPTDNLCFLISQRVSGVLSRANATKCVKLCCLCKSRQVFPAKMIRNRRICPNLGLARLWTTSPVSGRARGALGFCLPGQGLGWISGSLQIQKLSGVGAHGDKRSQLWEQETIPPPLPRNPVRLASPFPR